MADPVYVNGTLLLRDGLPIVDPNGPGLVASTLMTFGPDRVDEAYRRISALKPETQYRWSEVDVKGVTANMLVGKSPHKGSVPWEEDEDWDGWSDPLFTTALEVVDDTLQSSRNFDRGLKPMFRLQMAYMLLWSCIERYVSLRHHLGTADVWRKVSQLAAEPAFRESLNHLVRESRTIYSASRPSEKKTLDPIAPEKAVDYYYQVRCNITHRGKGVVRDHETLMKALDELLPIFRQVLKAARSDAEVR